MRLENYNSQVLTEVQIAYLEARCRNMQIYLSDPTHIVPSGYSLKLPVLRLEPVHDQKTLENFNYISDLIGRFRGLAQKMEELIEAQAMIGKFVIKKSRKPFQCGASVVKVRGVIRHPYRPGWALAYLFEVDGSCVSVDQLKEFKGG